MRRWPRKAVQLAALAAVVAVPMVNYAGVLYQQYGVNAHHMVSMMGTSAERLAYRLFMVLAPRLPDPAGGSTFAVGGFGQFGLGRLDILDPVVVLETLARSPHAWKRLLLAGAVALGLAAVLGRVFCGWLCPVNTILEGVDALRLRALPRLSIRLRDVSFPRWLKWVLLLGGTAAAASADVAVWSQLLPHVQLGRELASLVIFGVIGAAPVFIVFIILMELFVTRRAWCRCLCPTGALLGWVGKLCLLRVRKAEAGCLPGCSACARVCPMALNPAEPIVQAECLNCGACVASCPEQTLLLLPSLGIRRRSLRTAPASARAAGAAVALLALLAWSVPSAGHHMRGQPHYGYTENYPQVPTQETRAVVGDFTVTVVSYFFQGLRRERSDTPDDVQFFINLQNSQTHQSYTEPLRIEIWRDGSRLNHFEHLCPLEEAVYRVRQAIPGPGSYELRLSTGSMEGSIHVYVAGDPRSWTPYAVAALAAMVLVLFFLNRRRFPRWRWGEGGVAPRS